MTPFRVRPFAILTVLLLAVGACGDDSTSPGDLGTLDPLALNDAVRALAAPLSSTDEVSTNLKMAYPDLAMAGVEFDRAAMPPRSLTAMARLAAFEAAPTPPLAVTFPVEVAGSTFVYDTSQEAWEIDGSRTDAPTDGVRVIWYELDATNEIVLPLTIRGFADLTPAEHATLEPMRVRAVETAGGTDRELLDFIQALDQVDAAQWTETILAEGRYSDGTTPVDFYILSDAFGDDDAGTEDYVFEANLESASTRYAFRAEGEQTPAAYEDRITSTVEHGGQTTVLALTLTGSASAEDATGTLSHDGILLANVSVAQNRYAFTPPEGGEFSPSQSTQLNDLFRTVLLIGFEPLFRLPLFFL